MNTGIGVPIQARIRKSLVLVFCLALCFGPAVLTVGHASATTPQAVVGMPFSGQWAWNASVMQPYPPYVDSCANGASNCPGLSSHSLVHHRPGGGDWATDIYAAEGTAVKLDVPIQTGTSLTFSWKSVTSCGQSTAVNVIVDGATVGWLYYAHLNNAVTSGTITNGMTLGTVHDWGANCNPGVHVHTEFKNNTNYSCYVDNGNPGVALSYGANLAVLGSSNTGAQQACANIPTGSSGLFWGYPATVGGGMNSNVLSSTGTSWSTAWSNTNWTTPSRVVSGDFNGDGKTDFLYLVADGPGTVSATVVLSLGNGWSNSWSVSGWAAPTALAAGDFNGDGKADLLWAYSASGGGVNVNELYSTGSAWSLTWSASNWTTPTQIVAGDFNGDSKTDLAYLTSSGSGLVNVATLASTGGSGGWSTVWTASNWTAPTALVAGDFNGDGKTDLFWAYPTTTGGGVNANTLFSTGSAWGLGWSISNWTTPSQVVSGDFNGDGKSDLVYVMPSGTGTVNANTTVSNGSSWSNAWSVSGWTAPTALVPGNFTGN